MTDSRALRQRIAELETLLAESRASQRESQQHFQALVEHSPDLIAHADRQLCYLAVGFWLRLEAVLC